MSLCFQNIDPLIVALFCTYPSWDEFLRYLEAFLKVSSMQKVCAGARERTKYHLLSVENCQEHVQFWVWKISVYCSHYQKSITKCCFQTQNLTYSWQFSTPRSWYLVHSRDLAQCHTFCVKLSAEMLLNGRWTNCFRPIRFSLRSSALMHLSLLRRVFEVLTSISGTQKVCHLPSVENCQEHIKFWVRNPTINYVFPKKNRMWWFLCSIPINFPSN